MEVRRKECFKCRRRKPLNDFYAHPMMADGRLGKCKVCTKRDVKVNYRARWEDKVAYDLERKLTPRRLVTRHRSHSKHRAKHPDRAKARDAVGNAVRDGRLVKQPCRKCGTTKNVQAHHHDYSKPLDVDWLCRPCHLNEHGKWSFERFAVTGRPNELPLDHARAMLGVNDRNK